MAQTLYHSATKVSFLWAGYVRYCFKEKLQCSKRKKVSGNDCSRLFHLLFSSRKANSYWELRPIQMNCPRSHTWEAVEEGDGIPKLSHFTQAWAISHAPCFSPVLLLCYVIASQGLVLCFLWWELILWNIQYLYIEKQVSGVKRNRQRK